MSDIASSRASDPRPPRLEPAAGTARAALLSHALRLEILSLGWNAVEAVIALLAARAAGSIALMGFGLDSVVESVSATILLGRLLAERRAAAGGTTLDRAAIERLDRRAHRLVGLSLFLLAAWVTVEAAWSLWKRERPEPSRVGIALTAISLLVMVWLARAKRRAAAGLESRALRADAFQTTACWWLSLITLGGVGVNALTGWWWADPLAAIAMAPLLVSEGREAWRGGDCGCR